MAKLNFRKMKAFDFDTITTTSKGNCFGCDCCDCNCDCDSDFDTPPIVPCNTGVDWFVNAVNNIKSKTQIALQKQYANSL